MVTRLFGLRWLCKHHAARAGGFGYTARRMRWPLTVTPAAVDEPLASLLRDAREA